MQNSFFEQNTIEDILDEMEMVYLHDKRPWIIGYSGGKDSTTVCQLVFKMLQRLPEKKRHKKVYVVSSDTLVENPIIIDYLNAMSKLMGESAESQKLELTTHMVRPKPEETFWSLVIGLGYPTPEAPGFRWCTDRLKIEPSNIFIKDKVRKHGEVIILLGVRKAESIARARRIEGREIEGKLLNKHEVIENAYVYNPITELTTDDVWKVLLDGDGMSPWGANNNDLAALYMNKDGGECPFTLTKTEKAKDAPTCGNSRFGCWICTIVKEDKSLIGFIESGETWLEPLLDFRNWLISTRQDPIMRDWKRRNGAVYKKGDGTLGLGPYTLNSRQIILERLLELERDTGIPLITIDELKTIDERWDAEGDLTCRMLVDTYRNVYGKELPWDKYKKATYSEEIIDSLKSECENEGMPFELMSKLIISVNKNKHFSHKSIMRQKFDKILNESWLHYDKLTEGLQNEN